MSFTGVFGLVILVILVIALLGPSKLPRGLEELWLMITNFRRSQAEQAPITLEEARRMWHRNESPFYDLIQILYAAVEHLVELRQRIFVVMGVMLVGAIAAGFFANRILKVLKFPAGKVQMIFLTPTDMVWVYMEVILSVAAVVALPVLLYEALMFIRPALETEQEVAVFRSVGLLGMPLVTIFFVLGLFFAYFIMLPTMLPFLQGTGGDIASASWNIRAYYSFVLAVLLWIGAAFETPLIMALLARLGMVSPQMLLRQWRYAIVGVAFVAAAITPTIDPVNMAIAMAPLLGLYFLGVLMAKAAYRPR